jgi:hypothetical protein
LSKDMPFDASNSIETGVARHPAQLSTVEDTPVAPDKDFPASACVLMLYRYHTIQKVALGDR